MESRKDLWEEVENAATFGEVLGSNSQESVVLGWLMNFKKTSGRLHDLSTCVEWTPEERRARARPRLRGMRDMVSEIMDLWRILCHLLQQLGLVPLGLAGHSI